MRERLLRIKLYDSTSFRFIKISFITAIMLVECSIVFCYQQLEKGQERERENYQIHFIDNLTQYKQRFSLPSTKTPE
jgi:hypothetical protein